MRKNKSRLLAVILMVSVSPLMAGEPGLHVTPLYAALQSADSLPAVDRLQSRNDESMSRRTTALLYSCVLPGSGQTMLGHTYKGVGFTVVAFGSILTAAISHNNYIARNERLDALEYQYSIATNWITANQLYTDMIGVQKKLVQDRERRNIFLIVSAVVWSANIVDLLYNTEDMGETLFSDDFGMSMREIAAVDSPHKPLMSFSIPLY